MKIDKSFRNILSFKETLIKCVIFVLLIFIVYKLFGIPKSFADTPGLIGVYVVYIILLKEGISTFVKLVIGSLHKIKYIFNLKKKRIDGVIHSIQYEKNKFIIKVQENGNSYWTNYYYYSYNFKKKLLYNENLIGRKVLFLISNKKAIIDKII